MQPFALQKIRFTLNLSHQLPIYPQQDPQNSFNSKKVVKTMIRQRRFTKTNNMSHSLNYYANENFSLMPASYETNNFVPFQPQQPSKHQRHGLTEITQNSNCRIQPDISHEQSKRNNNVFVLKQVSFKQGLTIKNRQNDNIFTKINELIRQQETGIPICNSFKNSKVVINSCKDRPYTSLSLRNRKIYENSLPRGPVVLDFTPKQQPQTVQDNSKISTSRALMNYSKVYRNSSGDRFKVKRDRQYFKNFGLVSAQKMVLQQKQKKDKKDVIMQRRLGSSHIRRKSQLKFQRSKNRYEQQKEEFQIEGWEYFD